MPDEQNTTGNVITEQARQWATEPFEQHETTVSRTDIARYARAVGETNPVYYDVEAAKRAGHPDVLAPAYFPYTIRMQAAHLIARSDLEPDGSSSADVPPLPTNRAMAGETRLEMGALIHAGDKITLNKRIVDLYEKSGRSGALIFVTTEFVFANQLSEMVMNERFTRIYQ
ncbi:MaoC family dehydratase N-terminal domain-containing protein [uncultured Ilumatobacter sp.]|jgi:acyl dehydratase|uniref:FAS1-like dehydratase domain-containing protein n=1 Tax=uncultured Ilumatobacter sp. TaxID=879968 RepID=UPI00374EB320|tara:strand:- start:1135 stop:1647 length:513 start_codon:yes stop_codon:yes gene_type:complete